MKRVRKVVCYITCGDRLLVFTHRDFPAVGVQVPAGTVEGDEDLSLAALREAEEETGLSCLKVIRYLGACEHDISVLRPEIHERHFFHLTAEAPVPEKWLHFERHPSGGDLKEIAFECYWVKTTDVGKAEPELFLGFGEMLEKLDDSGQGPAQKPYCPAAR